MLQKLEYDTDVDAIYINLSNKSYGYTKRIDDQRYVDYAPDNTPIGIELLCVSRGVVTDDLPQRSEVERLLFERGIKTFA